MPAAGGDQPNRTDTKVAENLGAEADLTPVAAAGEAGIRLTLLDVCYLSGGLTTDGHQPLDHVQRRFSDGSVDAWAARVAAFAAQHADADRVRVGSAAHSVRALTEADLSRLAELRPAGAGRLTRPDAVAVPLSRTLVRPCTSRMRGAVRLWTWPRFCSTSSQP